MKILSTPLIPLLKQQNTNSKHVSDIEVDGISRPMASNTSSVVQLESVQVTAPVDKLNETSYVLIKPVVLTSCKTFCGMTLPKIQWSSIVDLHADSTETMQAVVAKLHKEYGIWESSPSW